MHDAQLKVKHSKPSFIEHFVSVKELLTVPITLLPDKIAAESDIRTFGRFGAYGLVVGMCYPQLNPTGNQST